jgi:hypothetical protein
MVMSRLRYQIVYRKLVRSLRKHYSFPERSRRIDLSPEDCEKIYEAYLKKASDLFGLQIERLGFKAQDIAICMGAFSSSKHLKTHFANQDDIITRINEVYDYLYKFSFERLQDFVQDPIMVMLFYNMMEVEASFPERHSCPLNALAEHEGSLLIIEHSCFWQKIAPAYQPQEVLATFRRRVLRAKHASREKLRQHAQAVKTTQ